MERRTAIAFVIIVAAYFLLFMNQEPPPVPPPGETTSVVTRDPITAPPRLQPADSLAIRLAEEDSDAEADSSEIVLRSEHATFYLTRRGAAVSHQLLRHFLTVDRADTLDIIPDVGAETLALALSLRFEDGLVADLSQRSWRLTQKSDSTAVFETTVLDRLHVRKALSISPEGWGCEAAIDFVNLTDKPLHLDYEIFGPPAMVEEIAETGRGVAAVYGAIDGREGDIEWIYRKDLQAEDGRRLFKDEPVHFVGLATGHFASLLFMESDHKLIRAGFYAGPVRKDELRPEPGADAHVELKPSLICRNLTVPAQGRVSQAYELASVPKDPQVLDIYKRWQLDALRDLGWFTSIGNLFLAILNGLYGLTGNYGWSIIILTIGIRALLHPLSRYTQKSMQKTQMLEPQRAEIQARYAGKKSAEARQKMYQEISELHRKHGVNPALGCLPMLLQIPILIALYQAILNSLDLRQAEFLHIGDWVWPRDLSLPDNLFTLPFHIPWPLESSSFNVLPVIVGVIMLIQQSMTPTPKDPTQASTQRMMKWMMLVLVVMFYSLPSGLLLYWGTSSLIGLFESIFVKRALQPQTALAGAAPSVETKDSAAAPSEDRAKAQPHHNQKKKNKKRSKKR